MGLAADGSWHIKGIRMGYCILASAEETLLGILAVGLDYIARSDPSHRNCCRKSQP